GPEDEVPDEDAREEQHLRPEEEPHPEAEGVLVVLLRLVVMRERRRLEPPFRRHLPRRARFHDPPWRAPPGRPGTRGGPGCRRGPCRSSRWAGARAGPTPSR